MASSLTVLVDDYWDNGWCGPTRLQLHQGRLVSSAPATEDASAANGPATDALRMSGAVFPGIYDSHVHLGLIEGQQLYAHGVSRVRDLGWDPRVASDWLDGPRGGHSLEIDIEIVGAFLTCAGGYPTDRAWAPAASICIVTGAADAARCVAEQIMAGASTVKVALNADAGAVFDAQTLLAIVRAAHTADVRVVAHAQGPGQAEAALAAGVDELAHAPWTELLPDELVEAMAGQMAWVSTFDIHGWGDYGTDFAIATDNARRFVNRGGRLRYGTDLGNGPLPVGVNERELLAMVSVGLDADQLATASFAPAAGARPMWIPGHRPPGADEFARWIAQARPLPLP